MKKKINIGEKAKVNIKWNVRPVDYTHEGEESIISTFAEKYGISRQNVQVEPVFITKTEKGDTKTVSDGIIGNLYDPKFQQQLFHEYIDDMKIEDIDFNKIIEIDDSINSLINYEAYDKRKKYTVKWIKWSNFMSYGPDNYFDFTTLDGLVLLSSEPANQGGKSTFCLDLLRFLLFGKVTSRENDWTLSRAFNDYLPEATEVKVEGCVEIDGKDYVIERTITRPSLKKRTEKSKVSQTVKYYQYANGEYIDLDDAENMEGDSTKDTNAIIRDSIGNEMDFDLMICVNDSNLKGLISLKDTERGRLISRWVGLLPLEEKDKMAREKFNTEIMKNMMSNRYSKVDVEETNKTLIQDNKDYAEAVVEFNKDLKKSDIAIEKYKKERDALLQAKIAIDDNLVKKDVETLETELNSIVEKGKLKRAEKKNAETELAQYKSLVFDEDECKKTTNDWAKADKELAVIREKAKAIKSEIKLLKESEFCPTCGAKLKNVDNTQAIKDKEKEFDNLVESGKKKADEVAKLAKKMEDLSKTKTDYDKKVRLELIIDKLTVEIDKLLSDYNADKKVIDDIKANKEAIKKNNDIDASVRVVDENIKVETKNNDSIKEQIAANNAAIKLNEKTISENKRLLDVLDKEEKEIRHWKVYLDMVGKKGVSKNVLRKILPLINGELKNILSGVCDFTVEIIIDDRNDVSFLINHNGKSRSLGSGSGFEKTVASLALRSVLSRISSFSKPSFVVFDEILGGVADENYDAVRLLYDKIVKDYAFILQISHLKQLYEWHNHFIKIKKNNDISVVEVE